MRPFVFFTLSFLALPVHAGPVDVREPAAKKEAAEEVAVPSKSEAPPEKENPAAKTEGGEAQKMEGDCRRDANRCVSVYQALMLAVSEVNCSTENICRGEHRGNECKDLESARSVRMKTEFDSVPSPQTFVKENSDTCITPLLDCSNAVKGSLTHDLTQAYGVCKIGKDDTTLPPADGNELSILLDVGRWTIPKMNKDFVGTRGAGTSAKFRLDEAVHIIHFLKIGRIDSDYKDCLVKEANALPTLTPEQREKEGFCATLYVDPPVTDYGQGPMPAKYADPIRRGIKAGLSRTEIPVKIEFFKRSECKPAILEQEKYYPGVLDYFRAISVDLDEVCEALIKKMSVKTWHFHSGNRSGPTAKPFAFEPQ